jgi:hypothetical protein
MTGMSNYSADATLGWITGQVAMPVLPSVWMALFTAVGTDAGTGFTEVSGSNYSRVQIAGSATTSGSTASGNATLHFSSGTPSWITAGMTINDATTAAAISAGTTVSSTTGTTVVMSANAAGSGVGSGDTITFSAFAAGTGTGPSTATNGSIITFPTPSGSGWGTIEASGLYDASTNGDLLEWDYLGNNAWLPCTISQASPGVFTSHAHGYNVGNNVVFSTEYGGTAPTFSQSNLTGLLAVAHAATDTFDVTNASTAVNTSSTGDGMVRLVATQAVAANVVLNFAASSFVLTQA